MHAKSPLPEACSTRPRRLYLYSRPHIDLVRVAGALCRP
ncbi:putative leader peptide [Streptomyces sp. NPDC001941]